MEPCGGELDFDQEGLKLWKVINFDLDLKFQHGDSHQKDIDEKNEIINPKLDISGNEERLFLRK